MENIECELYAKAKVSHLLKKIIKEKNQCVQYRTDNIGTIMKYTFIYKTKVIVFTVTKGNS